MTMHLLVIGFSVTEMPSSYVPILKRLVTERGFDVEVDHCGIGGVTIEDLSYMLDRILETRPRTTHVIFEISTGNGRHEGYRARLLNDPGFMPVLRSHIDGLIQSCTSRGVGCGFIGFPRRDADVHTDYVDRLIEELCDLRGRPFLRIGVELVRAGIPLDAMLYDIVHPTPTGAEYYAERALELIGLLRAQSPVMHVRSDVIRYSAFPLATLGGKIGHLERHGFRGDYLELLGGESILVKLPRPFYVRGLAALSGPRGGVITIQSAAFHEHMFYDEYSYYERVMTYSANIGRTDQLTITLSPDVPTIPLIKGERNLEQRRVGLLFLYRDQHGEPER